MSRKAAERPRGDYLTPTDLRHLGNPLDFIAEDHLRERQICSTIDAIADADQVDLAAVEDALSFLSEEMVLHQGDEEEGLFPTMNDRCEPEDEIEDVLSQLRSDHIEAKRLATSVKRVLSRLLSGGGEVAEDERAAMKAFASHARKHLIVENAIILPIARVRLRDSDLDDLRAGMLRRRGLDKLMEAMNADEDK